MYSPQKYPGKNTFQVTDPTIVRLRVGTFLFLAFAGSWHLSAIGVQLLAQTKQIWRVLKSSNPDHLKMQCSESVSRLKPTVQHNPCPRHPNPHTRPSEGVVRCVKFLQVQRQNIVMYIPFVLFTWYLPQKQMHLLSWQWLKTLHRDHTIPKTCDHMCDTPSQPTFP